MLLHRLCVALGVLHPDDLLARLTWPQIADWFAYMRQEPFGPNVDAQRFAARMADGRNYSMASKKHDWKVEDFMPKPPAPPMPIGQKIRSALGKAVRTRKRAAPRG